MFKGKYILHEPNFFRVGCWKFVGCIKIRIATWWEKQNRNCFLRLPEAISERIGWHELSSKGDRVDRIVLPIRVQPLQSLKMSSRTGFAHLEHKCPGLRKLLDTNNLWSSYERVRPSRARTDGLYDLWHWL